MYFYSKYTVTTKWPPCVDKYTFVSFLYIGCGVSLASSLYLNTHYLLTYCLLTLSIDSRRELSVHIIEYMDICSGQGRKGLISGN